MSDYVDPEEFRQFDDDEQVQTLDELVGIQPARAVLVETRAMLTESMKIARESVDAHAWYEWQWKLECKRVSYLEAGLLEERRRHFPFSDEDVAGALRRVYVGEPVSASDVAAELYPYEPTHSARIRTGHALGRLATAGAVVRHRQPDPRGPDRDPVNRWSPKGGDRA